jgi:hypothetical protein
VWTIMKVDCNNPQMMHCILSSNSPINASNLKLV